ncbi:MAG: serine hydrolase [Pirellulales bacterium]|nr:serine hydrolase [Pirellulales bacterium]
MRPSSTRLIPAVIARLVLCTSLVIAFVCAATRAAEPAADSAPLALLEKLREDAGSPALSVAVVRDGEIVLSGAAGLADLEHAVAATSETVYRIGSISKPITAVAVMQLVEHGKVRLDDSIHDYVPSFPVKNDRPIRIRELLNHTSGVRHYRGDEFLHAQAHATLESAIGIFKDDPLLFSPGERFSYTTYGFNLLAGVVEKASGQSFEDYLRAHVWEPAGMTSTRFDRPELLVPHRARPYERQTDGSFKNSPYVDLSIKWAGGGMLSTAPDLARFYLAVCGDKLISAATREAMFAPQVSAGGVEKDRGPDVSMALGWFTRTDSQGRVWVWHGGGSAGGRTLMSGCPAERRVAVVLTNCSDTRNLQSIALKLLGEDDKETTAAVASREIPWDIARLSEAPKFAWVDDSGPVRSLFYTSVPYGRKPTRVFAYYASPATLEGRAPRDKEQFPAVVLLHGGGGTAFREWAELWAKRGYAAIAMDLAGHRPLEGKNAHDGANRERLPDGGPNQGDDEKFGSIGKPTTEQWPYHAVAAGVLAHSLVRSFPEVDAERTAVTGISWGGYLTCIVAGVDNRFKAAVPVYGCGFLQENSAWVDRLAQMTPDDRERWVTLWDPSRYLPRVSMPILFVNGTNDFAYPLDSYMKSFDAVPGNKQLCVTVNMPHSHPDGWAPQEIGLFIDSLLRDGKPLAVVGELSIADGRLATTAASPLKLKSAALHFTTERGPINKRAWQTIAATIGDDKIMADAPPADATAWFVTVTDERGAVSSSRVEFAATK